jgi:diaminohydroxyphosphoribosylaminopyrimidine deaminase/5-amino-6-(5-phosphoribosylamino)uracil reductase
MNFLAPETHMEQALALAEKGHCTVSPNPMVGCLIVKDGTIVGQGYHQRAGEPHAEIYALKEAGEQAQESDVYVTLEPCCHYGRTPPCTEALIQAGVKRVFIACTDPNPLVAQKGIQALNAAGIETIVGIKEAEALELNKVFFHFIKHRTPYVIAKWAMSLDGKTITHPKDDRIISNETCRHHAHHIRQTVDAILIGSQTATADNPQLTVRLPNSLRQPIRIILSAQGNLSLDLQLFSSELPSKTIIAITENVDKTWLKKLINKNIEYWILPTDSFNQIDLPALLKKCGEQNITSLLVEGGERVRESFFRSSLVQESQIYLSPVWIGTHEKKHPLFPLQAQSLGSSLFITSRHHTGEDDV